MATQPNITLTQPMTTPQFPTYTGNDIPPVLQPWNPWHYWLLLKWLYFQPSKLRHYLYRSIPNQYVKRGRLSFFRASAYRTVLNLYIMTPLLALMVGMLIALLISVVQDVKPVWGSVFLGVAFGTAFGVTVTFVFGMVDHMANGVASVIIAIITWGVTGGAGSVVATVKSEIVDGVAAGVLFGMASGTLFGIAFVVMATMLLSVIGAFLVPMAKLMTYGVVAIFGVVRFPIYVLELTYIFLKSINQSNVLQKLQNHPTVWDELIVFPVPGLVSLLVACLSLNAKETIPLLSRIAANPFQRWAAQKALSLWLAQEVTSLSCLYHIIFKSNLNAYFYMPLTQSNIRLWPTSQELLLSEIGSVDMFDHHDSHFDSFFGYYDGYPDRFVWQLTRRFRNTTPLPLANFVLFLYKLLHECEWFRQASIDKLADTLEDAKENYFSIPDLLYGQEIALSFLFIAHGIALKDGYGIARIYSQVPEFTNLQKPLLRPTTMEILQALREVSREVEKGLMVTNRGQKNSALNRTNEALLELAEYVEKQVLSPEQVLLARLVGHWQEIIAKEQGKLGAEALQAMSPQMRREAGIVERQSAVWQRPVKPFDNPYTAGDPVYPPLLVGRTDIFNRIGEIWGAKENPDSIILYGHRRMGKSSILRNLAQAAPEKTIIAYADMQGETSFVASTEDFLLGLADRLYYVVDQNYLGALSQPHLDDYNSPARASRSFNVLTDNIRTLLDGKSLILALDEFEAVEKAVVAGKIGPEIYQFLRSKSMEPGLTVVFGGLHTLDEMSRDYAQPFYGSYTNIKVSYLSHQEAWRLITNPNEDFPLNYESEAVERIIAETGGQPYLVQLVCREALDYLNHTLFDLQQERDVLLTLADVEAVLDGGLFQRGMVYFDGVWSQATEENQRHLLRTLAGRAEPWAWDEMQQASGLTDTELKAALNWTERQDVMQKVGDPPVWQFYVPLMRQWIRTTKGIK